MKRLFPVLVLLLFTACGLAEDERDDKNKREYITFSDAAFERYCLENFDLNGDGRISLYEAERVLTIRCPDRGIRSLLDISYFKHLQHLSCGYNELRQLDLSKCTELRTVDCSHNAIAVLDVGKLRGLTSLNCSYNLLRRLELQSAASLATLDCRNNDLEASLDVAACSASLRADTRNNPGLTIVYCRSSQSIEHDGQTRLVARS